MRSTGVLSYDVLMVVTIDLRPFGGPVIAFAEKGNAKGTLVLCGNRAHTWDTFDMDSRIKDNWQFMRKAGISSTFTVEFGAVDLLAVVGTVIGIPVGIIALLIGGALAGENKKACGCYGHEYYDKEQNQWNQEKGAVIIDKRRDCPLFERSLPKTLIPRS